MRASPRPLASLAAPALLGLLALSITPAQAGLIHDYQFQGNLHDTLGGPDLVASGGTVGPSSYTFGKDQGLSLSNGLTTAQASTYTIELNFTFDATSGYRKILDFKNLTSDAGLYNLSTALNFYPATTGTAVTFADGVPVRVDLTRDGATGQVVGYVGGVQQISFLDTGGLAIFDATNNIINFFQDDAATSGNEASSGSVTHIQIFDTAALPASVPEPAALGLVASGLVLAGLASRKR